MNYVLLFLTDGLLGYFLQGIGYLLGICAFVKRPYKAREFWPVAAAFALASFGIRQISIISFGFHSVLIMIAFILLATLILKTPVFMTVMGVLSATIATLIAELINMLALSLFMGASNAQSLMAGNGTIIGSVHKAIAGLPTNLILLLAMFICYKLRMKAQKERKPDGETGTPDGPEHRDNPAIR